MIKPLILLVDDDFGVLSALEALVGMRFGESCRIEAFDDPKEVLEAVPQWESDGRRIAVAVVDQLMPGMTGVELLRTLQGSGPAAGLRAILLTAHPNLESALKAVNLAGAARYFEKPWKHRVLTDAIGELLWGYLVEAELLRYVRQAEVRDPETLLEVFKLRYSVYCMTPGLELFVRPNVDKAAMDPYDLHSIILGLFLRSPDGEKLVGTLRLTTRGKSPAFTAIRAAASSLTDAGADLEGPAAPAFPLLKLFADQKPLEEFITMLESKGGRVAEAGRHAILPDHRKGNTDRRQLEGTAAECTERSIIHVVAGIPAVHRRHYVALGFEQIPGVGCFSAPFVGMAIWSAGERVRPEVKPRVDAISMKLRSSKSPGGESPCFCPSYPECVPGPYLSGEFRHTDIYCPKSALSLFEGGAPGPGEDE